MSALRLINETEITSSVSSVDITDVFSADFDIYKITLSDNQADTNATDNSLRFINASGSVITASNYNYAFLSEKSDNVFTESKSTSANRLSEILGYSYLTNSLNGGAVAYIFNPFSSSSYTFSIGQTTYATTAPYSRTLKSIGVLKDTTSMTGFQLMNNAGNNFTDGTIRTYGLRVDNG